MLKDALEAVRRGAFYMKRCLDEDNLMEALKHANTIASELRTADLTPKNYYQLFMRCTAALQDLEIVLWDHEVGMRVVDGG